MTKLSQESVDKLIASLPEEQLRAIVRSYALTHPAFCEALRGGKAATSSTPIVAFDYKTEVLRCYRHFMKSPRWEHDWHQQPKFLDWELVGKDLNKVIKRAETSITAGRPDIAIETAFLILEMNDRQYEEDYLCEREDWDADDLCLDDCFKLIEKALSSPSMSKEQKLEICDRLDRLHHSELLEYTEYDLQELIDSVRGELLTDDEHLAIMMRDFKNESGWRKSSLACDIWDFLIDLGRANEAEAFFHDNPQVDELRVRFIGFLQSSGREVEVLKAIDEGVKLAHKQSLFGLERKWRERKLEILEARGDATAAAFLCKDLFADARGQETLKYYYKAKGLIDSEKWPSFRDTMLAGNPDLRHSADSPLAEIFKEEGLLDRLYNHLLNAKYNLLSALSRYAKAFTPQQQKNLIAKLEKEFTVFIGYNANRKSYRELASRLSALAKTCPAGKALATKVVAEYRNKFPNRPALIEELANVKL